MAMRRVFVYEFMSAGGGDDPGLRGAGVAMRDAIVDDLLGLPEVAVTVAVDDMPAVTDATAPSTRCLVRRGWGESAAAFVRRQAAAHDLAWIVAPESAGVLAGLQRVVDPARWLGCSGAAIALASSKSQTVRVLAAAGIATPLDLHDEARAWVVKPDDGAGTVDTRRHRSRAEALADLEARRRAGQQVTLEPWVDGEALSVTLLVDARGRADAVAFNRQRIVVGADGWLRDDGVDADALRREGDPRVPALAATATRVSAAIGGLFGIVGVDLVWHPRRGPVAIEVNPRVTCAYVGLSSRLGRNLAGEVLRHHAVRIGATLRGHA